MRWFSGDESESDTNHHAQSSDSDGDARAHGVEGDDGCAHDGNTDGANYADHNIMGMQSQQYFAALSAAIENQSVLPRPERQR